MSRTDAYIPLAVTSRSGYEESVHFGAAVGLSRDGSIAFTAGDPTIGIYPRSASKPMQATAMVQLGLSLPPDQLALVCASHDGTPRHLDVVRRILASVGLDETALRNTPGLPLDQASADDIIRAGGAPTLSQQNCSGKHSGMIAACVINNWPIDSYLDPEHPLQRAITACFGRLMGEAVVHVGVDGCGAPAHVLPLVGLATAFRAMAIGAAGDAGTQVYKAMSGHPLNVGGESRDVTIFMRNVPGLMAKDGAEGVFAAALPDGRAVALKVADGSSRARPAAMLRALEALDIDTTAVAPLVRQRIMGHGHEVGVVSAIVDFRVAARDDGADG